MYITRCIYGEKEKKVCIRCDQNFLLQKNCDGDYKLYFNIYDFQYLVIQDFDHPVYSCTSRPSV